MNPIARTVAGLAVALTLCAGCGDSTPAKPAVPHPASLDEATLLAGALNADATVGHADFTAAYQPIATNQGFKIEGAVKWADLTGHGTAYGNQSTGTIAWTAHQVTITDSTGTTSHQPDPNSNPVDYVISTIMSLASRTADNPSLVQQAGATVTASDDHTVTYTINDKPTSPTLTVDQDTGTVTQARFALTDGGHLTITIKVAA